MAAIAFDTLKFARALREKAHLSAEQAEAITDEQIEDFVSSLLSEP